MKPSRSTTVLLPGCARLVAAALLLMVVPGATALGAAPEGSEELPRSVLPEAARGDWERGLELYRAGDYPGALEAFQAAEKGGARSGLLYFQIGFCHGIGGDEERHQEFKRKAIPYFQRAIEDGEGGVDAYYYLAAILLQNLRDPDKARDVVQKAIAAHEGKKLGDDPGGESLFRLGRLYGFALNSEAAVEADAARKKVLEERRIQAYREAALDLRQQLRPNRPYWILALTEVAKAEIAAGNLDAAIEAYSEASLADPLRPDAGRTLLAMGKEQATRGNWERAVQCWFGVRGPGHEKTQANYALKLGRKIIAHGALPDAFEERPIAGLDRATLERGILEAAQFLREAAPPGVPPESLTFSPDPEEVRQQQGVFLALMMAYFLNGHDIRGFTVQNQLVPFVFR